VEIPKRPEPPELDEEETRHVTDVVFGPPSLLAPAEYEAIFVFGGSHPGIWETAIDQYRLKACARVFVTGGSKKSAIRHESWAYGNANEADVIADRLVEAGIAREIIVKESRSTNSAENVDFIRADVLGSGVRSLLCVCKSYGVGRQYRTIRKRLPDLAISMRGFDTNVDANGKVTRNNWWARREWRSLVWGEYLRNCLYAGRGDIERDFSPPPSLLGKLRA
jgi:uncharacterized SAM-binding protein YcdF (DUF218 family)